MLLASLDLQAAAQEQWQRRLPRRFLSGPPISSMSAEQRGGTRKAKIAVVRRVPAFRGQSYALIQRGFAQWHIDMRLDLTYPHPDHYVMQELLIDGSAELEAECIDRGTTMAAVQWVGKRSDLDDFLVAEHMQDLLAEAASYPPVVPFVLPPAPPYLLGRLSSASLQDLVALACLALTPRFDR